MGSNPILSAKEKSIAKAMLFVLYFSLFIVQCSLKITNLILMTILEIFICEMLKRLLLCAILNLKLNITTYFGTSSRLNASRAFSVGRM